MAHALARFNAVDRHDRGGIGGLIARIDDVLRSHCADCCDEWRRGQLTPDAAGLNGSVPVASICECGCSQAVHDLRDVLLDCKSMAEVLL